MRDWRGEPERGERDCEGGRELRSGGMVEVEGICGVILIGGE